MNLNCYCPQTQWQKVMKVSHYSAFDSLVNYVVYLDWHLVLYFFYVTLPFLNIDSNYCLLLLSSCGEAFVVKPARWTEQTHGNDVLIDALSLSPSLLRLTGSRRAQPRDAHSPPFSTEVDPGGHLEIRFNTPKSEV